MTKKRGQVGVAELKAHLSEHLRAVRKGHEVMIYDRDHPIARMVPYASVSGGLVVREPISSYRTLGDIPMPPPAKLATDAVALLIEERNSGR